jgi:hypothetical protein
VSELGGGQQSPRACEGLDDALGGTADHRAGLHRRARKRGVAKAVVVTTLDRNQDSLAGEPSSLEPAAGVSNIAGKGVEGDRAERVPCVKALTQSPARLRGRRSHHQLIVQQPKAVEEIEGGRYRHGIGQIPLIGGTRPQHQAGTHRIPHVLQRQTLFYDPSCNRDERKVDSTEVPCNASAMIAQRNFGRKPNHSLGCSTVRSTRAFLIQAVSHHGSNRVYIGSNEHKELFCRSFMESHRAYDPQEWPWPELAGISLARLRAIPIWTMALEVEIGAGEMLAGFAKTEPDPLVRQALELQGYEEDRHGRILQCMIDRYGLKVAPQVPDQEPTRSAFIDFGYNECVDSYAGFGIFRLAREARILPDALTTLFVQLLVEEARHIVFFVNWVAWDRYRRGLRGPVAQALPALVNYGAAIARRVKGGTQMQSGDSNSQQDTLDLFGDILNDLTPAMFLRACVEENERYMAAFDPRLLRPRVIPALGKFALAIVEAIDWIRAAFRKPATRST